MEYNLIDPKLHKITLRGEVYAFTTGKMVDGKWWWTSPDIHNPDGPALTREAAIQAAEDEIRARAL